MSNFIISNVDYCGDPRNRSMLSVTKVDNIIIIGCCMLSENIDAAYGWCRSIGGRCVVVMMFFGWFSSVLSFCLLWSQKNCLVVRY